MGWDEALTLFSMEVKGTRKESRMEWGRWGWMRHWTFFSINVEGQEKKVPWTGDG